MLSPHRAVKHNFESIIGSTRSDLLQQRNAVVVKRDGKHSLPHTVSEQTAKEEGEETTVKTVRVGAIKFLNIPIPKSAPTDLVCEECEIAMAVLFCRRCDEVICMHCADLIHPVPYGEPLHPHERDDMIRPVQVGDRSRVRKDGNHYLPDEEFHEDDYMKIKDLRIPQSLSTVKGDSKPSGQMRNLPKFKVNQLMLFIDPVKEIEAYGRIISQWDFRLSNAAPAILRGDDSLVYYVVNLLGYVKDVRRISSLLVEESHTIEKLDASVRIDGVQKDDMIEIRRRTHALNKRVSDLHGLRLLGPKYHMRDLHSTIRAKNSSILQNRAFGLNVSNSDGSTTLSSSHIQLLYPVNESRNIRLGTQNAFTRTSIELRDDAYDGVDLDLYADIDTDIQSQLPADHVHRNPLPAASRSYETYLAHSQDWKDASIESLGNDSSVASLKSHEHSLPDDDTAGKLPLNILVMSEIELFSLEERVEAEALVKQNIVKRFLMRLQKTEIQFLVFKCLMRWKATTRYLRDNGHHIAAVKIQALVRMHLCRDIINGKLQAIEDLRKEKWMKVHGKYRYSDATNPLAKTTNKVIYFETIHELNKYSAFLRLCMLKIIKLLNRKRIILLQASILKWKSGMAKFLESDIKVSHFHHECIDDFDSAMIVNAVDFVKSECEKIAVKFQKKQKILNLMANEYSYETASCLPLRLPEKEEYFAALGDGAENNTTNDVMGNFLDLKIHSVPSYTASDGMVNLPSLPQIFIPSTADDRKNLKTERRLNYCFFKDKMEGPTFDSNWVIPQVVLMGSIPWSSYDESNAVFPNKKSKARLLDEDIPITALSNQSYRIQDRASSPGTDNKRTRSSKISKEKVSAISMLLLSGIDVFVSLMEEEEESLLETNAGIDHITLRIDEALKNALVAVEKILRHCREVINKQQSQINAIPPYSKSDPRYPGAYREQLRCKARIQVATDNMNKSKCQIRNLAPVVKWIRVPLKKDGTGVNRDGILSIIWKLEELIRQGRKLYIYSAEGHGRAGLISGILLGRIYNLHPYETLYRLQASHDSALREIGRQFAVNCPQLPNQRNVLSQILNLTNLPLNTEVVIRSQKDPETFVEKMIQRPVIISMYNSSSLDNILTTKKPNSIEIDGLIRTNNRSRRNMPLISFEDAARNAAQAVEEKAFNLAQGNNIEIQEKEKVFYEKLYASDHIRMKSVIVRNDLSSRTVALLPTNLRISHRPGINIRGGNGAEELSESSIDDHVSKLPPVINLSESAASIYVLPLKRQQPAQAPNLPLIRSAPKADVGRFR